MKLAVFGNSVSLPPREAPSTRPWPDLLASEAPEWTLVQASIDGGSVIDLKEVARRTIAEERPDAVIVQTGIVDCAPRPLAPRERVWVGRLPWPLYGWAVWLLHRYRAQIIERRSLIQVTPLASFRESFLSLVRAAADSGARVAALAILPGTTSVRRRNPTLEKEIDAYNDAMRHADTRVRFFDAAELIGGAAIDDLAIAPDSVHLNQEGHARIARSLGAWLRTDASATGG